MANVHGIGDLNRPNRNNPNRNPGDYQNLNPP